LYERTASFTKKAFLCTNIDVQTGLDLFLPWPTNISTKQRSSEGTGLGLDVNTFQSRGSSHAKDK